MRERERESGEGEGAREREEKERKREREREREREGDKDGAFSGFRKLLKYWNNISSDIRRRNLIRRQAQNIFFCKYFN